MRFLFVFICLIGNLVQAQTIQRMANESDESFATRNVPYKGMVMTHVATAKVWGSNIPVIVSFYHYPSDYIDDGSFKGDWNSEDSPKEKYTIGYVFVPTSPKEYKKIEIDVYGQEGADAEINSIFFAKTDQSTEKKLFVMVVWHSTQGTLYKTFVYDSPQSNVNQKKLTYLEKLVQQLGIDLACDRCNQGDEIAPYKTAADVKAKLKILVNQK